MISRTKPSRLGTVVRPPLEMFEQTEGSSWLTTSTRTETGLVMVVMGTSPTLSSFLLLLLLELSARNILLKVQITVEGLGQVWARLVSYLSTELCCCEEEEDCCRGILTEVGPGPVWVQKVNIVVLLSVS